MIIINKNIEGQLKLITKKRIIWIIIKNAKLGSNKFGMNNPFFI
jgi:hypothetical protein